MNKKTLLSLGYLLSLSVLITTGFGIILYKVYYLDYSFSEILPLTRYHVVADLRLDGHGDEIRIHSYLPLTDHRQTVSDEQNNSPGLYLSTHYQGLSKRLTWTGSGVPDGTQIRYGFEVLSRPIRYEIAHSLKLPATYPPRISLYLRPEKEIQVDDPEIRSKLLEIKSHQGPLFDRLKHIYNYTGSLPQRPFKGTTDALTALRLGEASCNGKSRLFVALARAAGIPSRLVGGLVLKPGVTRTSHQWVEAYIGGRWVPFGPTNHHFAELPANYLTLYYGDESLFRYSKQINFQYRYEVESFLVPSRGAKSVLGRYNVWAMFERLGLPLSLLRTLLMLPIGALVVVLFRNVVGLPTFGTFLPALIAAASGETGAEWGLLGVLLIVVMVTVVRLVLGKLELLHSPTLAILLTLVAGTMLGTTMLAEKLELMRLTRISLLPIAVLAITAERFYLILIEKGSLDASKYMAGTSLVIVACYVVMNSLALQIIVTGFPEVLLLVIAINIYLGRWVGVRLSEYLRFHQLLRAAPSGPEVAL